MAKRILEAHPCVTIAHNEESGKLLMAVYDEGYPQEPYRLSANNIGGNPSPEDGSPFGTDHREISEEFDPEHPPKVKFGETGIWAPKEDIALIQGALLGNLTPYQDFYVDATEFGGNTHTYTAVYSVFSSLIDQETMACAERNVREGKRLVTEGLSGVFTLDQLVNSEKGKHSTAHATAPILNEYFGIEIPFPTELKAETIGTPRDSYEAYLADFEYGSKIAEAVGLNL